MNTFQLKIIASNKVFFDGEAQSLSIPRLNGGCEAYLAKHENCVVPIEFGEMKIVDANGKKINAFVGSGNGTCCVRYRNALDDIRANHYIVANSNRRYGRCNNCSFTCCCLR